MPDTFSNNAADTLGLLHADSTVKVSHLQVADSLQTIICLPPPGMEGIPHPSVPATESWVFLVNIVLFFFLITAIIQSAGVFSRNFRSFFSHKSLGNLIAKPTANIAQFQFFITVFTVCTLALAGYEYVFGGAGKFQFRIFLILCAYVSGFYILKYLLFEIVGNTFFNMKTTYNYKNMYFGLMNMLAITTFPLLILYTYQPANWHQWLEWGGIATVIIFYIILIIKLFQNFYTKPAAFFYIFLYLCILEILPVLALIRVCEKII